MRDIEFRGKRKHDGKWVYGDYMRRREGDIGDGATIWTDWETGGGFGEHIDPETVGQYTGLRDIHNAKIFEGDVVKLGKIDLAVVRWKENDAAFELFNPAWDEEDCSVLWNCPIREVVGNIYDNPELLEVKP